VHKLEQILRKGTDVTVGLAGGHDIIIMVLRRATQIQTA
jgi:hypothetical protein